MKKIYKKVIAIFTIVMVSFAGLFFYLLTTPYGENIVRKILEKQFSQSLGLQVEIKSFETNVVSRIHLSGLHVSHMIEDDENSLITSGEIRITYQLWRLLSARPHIETVVIDSLKVNIVSDSTGFRIPVNLEEKKVGAQSSRNFMFQFNHFDVMNSTVAFDELTVPLHLLAQNITFNLQEKETGSYSFRLDSDTWNVQSKESHIPVNSLSAAGEFSSEMLSIEKFKLILQDMDCDIKSVINFDESPFSFNGRLNISGNVCNLKPFLDTVLPPDLAPTQGTIDTEILFSGTPADPQLSFSFNANDIIIKDVACQNISLNGNAMNRLLILDKCEISLFNGKINGRGQFSADSLFTHNLELEYSRLELSSIWDVLKTDPSPYSGYIDGKLETHGPLRIPLNCNSTAQIALKNILFRSNKINDFNCNVSFDNKRLTVEAMQPKTDINAYVSFTEKTMLGKFGLKTTNLGFLAGLANVFGLKGMVDIHGEISGNTASPLIKVGFSGRDIQYLGFPIDSIQGGITYNDGGVFIEKSVFKGELRSFDSLTGPLRVPGLYGIGIYSGSLKGELSNLIGLIDLDLIKPEYKGFSLDDIKARISMKENRFDIENATLIKDTIAASLNGRYDITSKKAAVSLIFDSEVGSAYSKSDSTESVVLLDKKKPPGKMTIEWTIDDSGEMYLTSSGANVTISDIARIKTEPVLVSGLVDYDFKFEGSLSKPNVNLNINASSPAYNNTSFDSLSGNIHIKPDRLLLESLDIFVNGQKTATHGEIALKQSERKFPLFTSDSEIDFSSQGYNVSIQLLKQLMPPTMLLNGSSKYDLAFKGTIGQPEIKGTIAFINTELYVKPDFSPILFNVQASLDDSTLVINNATGSIGEIPFAIRGDCVTYDWKEFLTEVNISIYGRDVFRGSGMFNKSSLRYQVNVMNFDTSLLQGFLPQIENLGGVADSKMSIAGPYRDPYVTGTIDIKDIEFRSPLFSEAVNGGTISLSFDQKSISIDSLSTYLGKGWISAKGTASYNERTLSNVDLTASASKLNFNHPKDYRIIVDSAQLSCRKRDAYYILDGEIVLGESRFIKNIDIKKLLPFMQKVERPSPDPSPLATHMRMNILIRNNKNLWINNNFAHFRIRSDLGLIGTLARPNMTGRITVEEGYLIYLDKKFKIVNGVMEFIDPNRLNPLINLTASTLLKNYQSLSGIPYTITLNVAGPLDEAVFSLTSEPQLDKPDIMALLTIGATRNQLTGQKIEDGNVSLSEILKERAAALSSQKLSGYVTERFGSILGLEEISIEGNLFNVGKSSGPQLVASEKINERMGITYTTAVGHMNDQRIRLDYRLNRFFSLVGETDQRGRSALDVKYKLRFK